MSFEAGTVVAAYLHPGDVSHSFSTSLLHLVGHDASNEGRVIRTGGPLMLRCGPGGLVEARNQVVKTFLDHSAGEWLWSVDSDMGFAPDTIDRLVAAADPIERPVVGGLCFANGATDPDGMFGFRTQPFPTLFLWQTREHDGTVGFSVQRDYPANTLTRVAGTGAACLLMHRSVLERIRETEGDVWFDRLVYPETGEKIAEDLSFCSRVGRLGLPVYVHTGVRTTHHKEYWLAEADYWSSYVPPPATDETTVLVPVMKRPQNAEPFMTSLRASTGLARVIAISDIDDCDSWEPWVKAGAEVLVCDKSSFAAKVNHGYREAKPAPWYFITGDDVRFRPGWLDHAQHIARTYDAKVVGTNDLGTERVQQGEHATHMLIARDYVEEVGASFDGPGIVCHEGYGHWFVDDEIVTAAKSREVFQAALGSIVEHMHPLFGKGEPDDVYNLGSSTQNADRKLFVGRCGSYLGAKVKVNA